MSNVLTWVALHVMERHHWVKQGENLQPNCSLMEATGHSQPELLLHWAKHTEHTNLCTQLWQLAVATSLLDMRKNWLNAIQVNVLKLPVSVILFLFKRMWFGDYGKNTEREKDFHINCSLHQHISKLCSEAWKSYWFVNNIVAIEFFFLRH